MIWFIISQNPQKYASPSMTLVLRCGDGVESGGHGGVENGICGSFSPFGGSGNGIVAADCCLLQLWWWGEKGCLWLFWVFVVDINGGDVMMGKVMFCWSMLLWHSSPLLMRMQPTLTDNPEIVDAYKLHYGLFEAWD
eukprot:11313684-Ditylum_brightwellii.AAC.1